MSAVATDRRWKGFVPGHPAPKGSIVQWRDGNGINHTRESSHRVKPWVAEVHRLACLKKPAGGPLRGPVGVRCTFYLPRPQSNDDPFPMDRQKGDVDKLIRAVMDGLMGPVLVDDSEVVVCSGIKTWAPSQKEAGVVIVAWEIPLEDWGSLGA